MPRVDKRKRRQAVLANKRAGALAASTSRGRQRLKRLVRRLLGKR